MRTSVITMVLSLILIEAISQVQIKRQVPFYEPSKNKGGNIVLPLVDPINFFQQTMIGPCVQVSNLQITYTGDKKQNQSQIGIWNDTNNTLGIDYGLILSTGNVFDAIDVSSFFASTNLNGPGDQMLSNIVGFPTYDAVIIEFDFIPLADSIIPFEFIFASEEYPEWVGSDFNDIFGFFIDGPGFNGLTNIAIVPGTNLPIAINNINNSLNSSYYIDNTYGTFWAYDGYTVVFTLNVPVIANQQYHFRIALADVSDGIYDSAIILKAGSFAGNISQPQPSFTYSINGNTVTFTNTSTNGMNFLWDFGDGTTSTEVNPVHEYSSPQVYQVTLRASNYCYENEITITVDLLSQNDNIINQEKPVLSELLKGVYQLTGSKQMPIVYSINGNEVKTAICSQNNGFTIDLSPLPQGMYILKSGENVFKILK
jgi:PKD repeat protein